MKCNNEMVQFYGEQLEIIKEINKSKRRENGFLICLVIVMALLLATS